MRHFNFTALYLDQIHISYLMFIVFYLSFMKSCLAYLQSGQAGSAEEVETAEMIMLPLFPPHRDGQLVFLTEEERASLAQINPCSSEPSDSGLLERLFSSDISSVYRLGKAQEVLGFLFRGCATKP